MENNKQLIYRAEPLQEPIPPITFSQEPPPPPPVAPRPRRGLAGLTVGIALFAMAFLLCEGAWAIRGGEGMINGFLGQSFAGETTSEEMTGSESSTEAPVGETTTDRGQTVGTSAATQAPPAVQEPIPEDLYTYDATAVPAGMIPIVPMDLSLSGYGESFFYNDTSYSLTLGSLAPQSVPTMAGATAGQPSVLILHTHATEGYSGEGATYYDPSTTLARATGEEDGVIAVGQVMADYLNANGIVTLHSTTLHDKESYQDSYRRSGETLQRYLKQYPGIRLVIDLHRDSIMTSADKLVRPVTAVAGQPVAQVMCVVGSDAAGGDYADWQKNLSLAVGLRNRLNQKYTGLCRPVYVKKSAYNQQYAPASLLLEVGSSGNSLDEAKAAALLVAQELVEMLGG